MEQEQQIREITIKKLKELGIKIPKKINGLQLAVLSIENNIKIYKGDLKK
jgi:hypothetical protein